MVGIDGRDGSGKTTLGRYLAWHFNVSLLETDLFLVGNQEELKYYDNQIKRIIRVRLTKPRPVIVEGVALLRLLSELHMKPDFLIYVRHPDQSSGRTVGPILDSYESKYRPETLSDLLLTLDH
jgi:adenylate kinase family enzyme